jgi:hypothetical protein
MPELNGKRMKVKGFPLKEKDNFIQGKKVLEMTNDVKG